MISLSSMCLDGILNEVAFAQCDADASGLCKPGTLGWNVYIDRVIFNEIDHSSGYGYGDYTAVASTTLERGQTYTLTVNCHVGFMYVSPQRATPVSAFIDWDGDGSLSDEDMIQVGLANYGQPVSKDITVPQSAASGPLVMRILEGHMVFDGGTYCGPCGECIKLQDYEDYSICLTEDFIDIGLRVYDEDVTAPIAIAAEPLGTLTSPLRIAADMDDNGTPEIYGIVLIDSTDPEFGDPQYDSGVRIRTGSGDTKALRKL